MRLLVLFSFFLVASWPTSSEAFDLSNITNAFEEYTKNSALMYNITNVIEQTYEKIEQDGLKLKKCYDSSIGNENVSIFHESLFDVFETYAKTNNELFTFENIEERIHNFCTSLYELINLIIECMEQPEEKQTKFGLTSLSAYSPEEYQSLFHPYNLGSHQVDEPKFCYKHFDYNGKIPESFDWRDKGMVTAIKDQSLCGSCWVFSAVGATESAYLIQVSDKANVSFSEQAIINCVPTQNGCTAGWMDQAWREMMQIGVVNQSEEPYHARSEKCHVPYKRVAEIKDYCFHKKKVEDKDIQALIIQNGPTVAAIESSSQAFKHLKGPFNYDCTDKIDHAVLIVGWTPEYWIIKNSWGTKWGIDGFLLLDRTVPNKCGVNSLTGSVWVKQ